MTEVTVERRNYPILGSKGASIDWQLVVDHGGQAYKNHRQSVERLAERGGLSWVELYAVLNNQQWQKIDENEAIIACRSIEAKYLSAVTEPASTDTLARLQRERDQAVELVKQAVDIFTYCTVEDGVCCCGDYMDKHSNPMSCGHSPVDHGSYVAGRWREDARATLASIGEAT